MPLFHDAHDEGADHHAHHLADAAQGRGSADEAGGDHVELEGIAGSTWRSRIQPRGARSAPARCRQYAHVDEGKEDQSLGADARELRRQPVTTECVDAAPDGRARGDEHVEQDQRAPMVIKALFGRPRYDANR